ncbi:MAG: alpha/beta fold hydrolase [Thalassotalea sp.]
MTTSARPIVFLRGLLREQGHWGAFKDIIQQALPERQCLFYDLAGNGIKNQTRSPASIQGLRLALSAELAPQLKLHEKIDIVSLSMGGMIALDWARAVPEQINSIILINTSLKNYAPIYQRLRLGVWLKIFVLAFSSRRKKESLIYDLTSNRGQMLTAELIEMNKTQTINTWLALAKKQPVSINNALKQLYAAATFSLAEKPPVRLHLIASEHDRLVSVLCSQAIAKAWKIELIKHPWAGHDIALDDPNWLSEKIKQCLNAKVEK